MNQSLMFSSRSELWETPEEFFEELDKEFHFTLDVCALPENAKCSRFYTPEQDGLKQPWEGVCWCNPPYGRRIGEWVRRAAQAAEEGAVVVMLLPSRTDTRWFHEYLYRNPRVELRFVKGRLRFGGSSNSAPFPSLVAVFRNENIPFNPPLTLDELREMEGEPVYCVSVIMPDKSGWGIMCAREKCPYVKTHIDKGRVTMFFYLDTLGVEWLAYRRRPEEETV